MEEARASALGRDYEGSAAPHLGTYKGGREMASSSQNDLCADPQLLTELGEFNQWLQSMHAAQSLLTENRIPCDGARADETPGLDGLPVGLAKTGLGLRRPEKKRIRF